PLAVLGLSFAAAGFVGTLFPSSIRWILTALYAVLLLFCLLPLSRRLPDTLRRTGKILFCGLLLGGLLLSAHSDFVLARPERKLAGQSVSVTGIVRERKYTTSFSTFYVLRITDGMPGGFSVLLETDDTTLVPGEEIRCTASFSSFSEYREDFAEKRYYYSLGISLQGEAEDVIRTGAFHKGLGIWIADLRQYLSARLQVSLGRRDAALPAALFLGDRSELPDSLTRDMRRLGIAHMLAISGQHFAILLGVAEAVLKAVLPSKKSRTLLLAGLCIFYMLLAGLSESVLRSGLMMLITYAAVLLRRDSDFYTSLGLAASLICLCNPASFYSIGLQLSVASIAILGCASRLQSVVFSKEPSHPVLHRCLMKLMLPLLVQTGLLPLLCLYFGEASLLTPLATVLFTPLVKLLLYLTPLQLLMPHLAPLSAVLRLLVHLTAELAELLSSIRGISLPLTYTLCPLFALLLSGTLLSTGFLRHRRQMLTAIRISGALFLCFGLYLGSCMWVSSRQNTVLSVQEKGNDALIVFSRGKTLLCDISDGSYGSIRSFYDAARARHTTEAEALMLTHLHKRHIHSFTRLSGSTYVRNLILPVPVSDSEKSVAESLCEIAAGQNIPVHFYDAAAHPTVRFGSVELLPGARTYLSRSTHPVITLRVQCGEQALQYLGTSWNETEECPHPTDAQILILGAHGPIYKSDFALPSSERLRKIVLRGDSGAFVGQLPTPNTVVGTEPTVIRFSKESGLKQ
ncbi:MAG: ComEC/Rec2 family competence protein, partial [Clostridia bacterium]|nr:ComEC/Rec2 family competence protein [Clostridia bacterium]